MRGQVPRERIGALVHVLVSIEDLSTDELRHVLTPDLDENCELRNQVCLRVRLMDYKCDYIWLIVPRASFVAIARNCEVVTLPKDPGVSELCPAVANEVELAIEREGLVDHSLAQDPQLVGGVRIEGISLDST